MKRNKLPAMNTLCSKLSNNWTPELREYFLDFTEVEFALMRKNLRVYLESINRNLTEAEVAMRRKGNY